MKTGSKSVLRDQAMSVPHGFVRADHDHRLGIAGLQIQQRRLDGCGVARVEADRNRLHAAPFKCGKGAEVTGTSEGVVLEEHGDALDAQVDGQPFNHLFGFLGVRGTQVDDVGPVVVAQETCPRERVAT